MNYQVRQKFSARRLFLILSTAIATIPATILAQVGDEKTRIDTRLVLIDVLVLYPMAYQDPGGGGVYEK